MHRFREQDWNPPPAERRRFGLMLAAGSPLSAVLWFVLVRLGSGQWVWAVPAWVAGLGAGLGLLLAARPAWARPFYCAWYFLVCCIDLVVTNALLTVMYLLVLTPIALAQRLVRRQTFRKGFNRDAATYWQAADNPTDPRQYFRQF
jgi:hypothetical protein